MTTAAVLLFVVALALIPLYILSVKKTGSVSWSGGGMVVTRSYALIAGLLLLFLFTPSPSGGWTLFWTIPAWFFALSTVLMGVEWGGNNIGQWFDGFVWDETGSGRFRMARGKLVQFASAAMMVVATVVMWVVTLVVMALHGLGFMPSAQPNAEGAHSQPAASAPASPTKQDTPSPAPSKQTASNASCTGLPELTENPNPDSIDTVKTGGAWYCKDGAWTAWTFGTVKGHAASKATATTTVNGKSVTYTYARFVADDGTVYTIRVTQVKPTASQSATAGA